MVQFIDKFVSECIAYKSLQVLQMVHFIKKKTSERTSQPTQRLKKARCPVIT